MEKNWVFRHLHGERNWLNPLFVEMLSVVKSLCTKRSYHKSLCTSAQGRTMANKLPWFDKNYKGLVVVSNVNEIHFNLAVEDYLMNVIKPFCPLFFWWRNASNVVIGRHQNPWKECRWELMEKNGVDLARRFSGGGAVYQDLGNSCFTFLLPESCYDQEKNNRIILSVLRDIFNIKGEPSGRNDLIANGRKFSGSAFKQLRRPNEPALALHHGTILIDTNLEAIQKYLTPNTMKLQSRGVSSVASRVINLKELNPKVSHDALQEPLIQRFSKEYSLQNSFPILHIDKSSSFTQDPQFLSVYNLLKDWNWRFGKTPHFSHRIEERLSRATVELHLDVKSGKIEAVQLFSDSILPHFVPLVEKILLGAEYSLRTLEKRFREIQSLDDPYLQQEIDDIYHMLRKHLSE